MYDKRMTPLCVNSMSIVERYLIDQQIILSSGSGNGDEGAICRLQDSENGNRYQMDTAGWIVTSSSTALEQTQSSNSNRKS